MLKSRTCSLKARLVRKRWSEFRSGFQRIEEAAFLVLKVLLMTKRYWKEHGWRALRRKSLAWFNEMEIERAIDAVKEGGQGAKKRWLFADWDRWNDRSGVSWKDRAKSRLRIGPLLLDDDELDERVMIDAYVPKAFFLWFEERRRLVERDRKMLADCFFREE